MLRHVIKAALHSPVVDLLASPTAEFFSNAAAVSAAQMLADAAPPPLWIQRRNPPGFRDAVLLESGLDPRRTSDALQMLEQCRGNWRRISPALRVSACRTMLQMGLQHEVLGLLQDFADGPCMQLQVLRISAQVALFRTGHIARIDAHALIESSRAAGRDVHAPIEERCACAIAAFLLGMQCAAGADTRSLCEDLRRIEAELAGGPRDFRGCLMRSRLWRAAAMYPHACGELERMRHEMDLAEQLALEAPAGSEIERFLRKENLFSVYESRVKESMALQDLEAAHRFSVRLVDLFPTNATARIVRGEVLLAGGEPMAAATQYSLAAGYAPPGGAVAWFMAGECFSQAGAEDRALACYLASFKEDEQAISAIRQAAARSSDSPAAAALRHWTERTLGDLETMEETSDTR